MSIVIFGWRATAQKIADYEIISTNQGLSQGMVFDLLQDQEGFIWAAPKMVLIAMMVIALKFFPTIHKRNFAARG
ncbi:MAG: hypothetical protein WKF97_22445 [Chitinophagaceae bacterium]